MTNSAITTLTDALPSTRSPARKSQLCYSADFRGYTHHCSRLMWAERAHWAAGVGLTCADRYTAASASGAVHICN